MFTQGQRNKNTEGEADTWEGGKIKETEEKGLWQGKHTTHTHTRAHTHTRKGIREKERRRKSGSLGYSVCVWPQLQHFFPL